MNNIWKAYFDMFKESSSLNQSLKHKKTRIVNEDTNDDWDDDDDNNDDTDDDWDDDDNNDDTDDDWDDDSDQQNQDDNDDTEFEEDEEDNQEETDQDKDQTDDNQQDKQNKKDSNTALIFSADLAAEFGSTCNKFTNVAVKVVKARNVDKQTADELNNIIDKLKSLLDAAKNTSK